MRDIFPSSSIMLGLLVPNVFWMLNPLALFKLFNTITSKPPYTLKPQYPDAPDIRIHNQ